MVLQYTGQECDVTPFSDEYESTKGVPIVTAATAYVDETGLAYILILHQALYFPNMEHSLLNPNQIRYAGNDVWDNPFDESRALEMRISSDDHEPLVVPIKAKGTILYFDSRTPTQHELDTAPHFQLTLERDWDPHNVKLSHRGINAYRTRQLEEEKFYGSSMVKSMLVGYTSIIGAMNSFIGGVSNSGKFSQPADLPNAHGFQSND